MRLEERPDQRQVVRIAFHHSVRVPDGDRRHFEARDPLGLVHVDLAEILLDVVAADHPRADDTRADADSDVGRSRPLREPARRDPRPVAGQFGGRAIGVPDHDLGLVAARRDDLEDAVRGATGAELTHAFRVERLVEVSSLDEPVDVSERVPLRECRRRRHPLGDRRQP